MVSEVSKKYKIKNKKRKKENKDVLQKNKKLKPLKNWEPPKNDGATDNLAEEVPLVRNSDDPIIPKVFHLFLFINFCNSLRLQV